MNKQRNDTAAFREMMSDMVIEVLKYAGNPGQCGEYVTRQIRELIGVRFVLLAEFSATGTDKILPVSFCPPRKEDIWQNDAFKRFAELAADFEEPAHIRAGEEGIGAIAEHLGFRESFVAPLNTGYERIGMLLLVDLMESAGSEAVLNALKQVSGVVALVLRNALFYRKLEHLVSERTRELQEKESRLRFALEATNEGIWDVQMTTGEVYLSPRGCEILGYGQDEAAQVIKVWDQLVHPDDMPATLEQLNAHIEGRTPLFMVEQRLKKKNGSWVWILTRGKIVARDGDGKPLRMTGTHTDISVRKQAELEVRQWALLFQMADFGLTIVNAQDNTFTAVNPAFARERGYEPEELIGQPIHVVYPLEKHEEIRQRFQNYRGNRHDIFESVHMRKDGSCFPVLMEVTVISDAAGNPVSRLAYTLDISSQKKAAEKQEHLQRQLVQAQKMEAIGILAGGIAHDFNNILQGIIVNLDLMKFKYPSAGFRDSADDITALALKAADLTKGMLAYSRQQIFTLKTVDTNEVVQGAVKLLFRMLGEDISVSAHYTKDPLTARLDSGQIQQVILNLAANARDAMTHGGELLIETGRMDIQSAQTVEYGIEKPGSYAVISVTDSGSGISRKDLVHIFDPFYTTKEVGKGTGLGLAIVFGIIKQHNGTVTVYSEEGKGTTFRIYLPLHDEQPVDAVQPEHHAIVGGHGLIMLVEDDLMVNTSMQRLLDVLGYEVQAYSEPNEALQAFAQTGAAIDLVILDVIMPGKSGKEVLAEMQRIRPDVKALFISGYPADFLDKKGMLEASFHLLMKPVMPQTLAEKIRDILSA